MRSAFAAAAALALAHAAAADELRIVSDNMHSDEETAVFSQDVSVTGARMTLRADKLRVEDDGATLRAIGKPAVLHAATDSGSQVLMQADELVLANDGETVRAAGKPATLSLTASGTGYAIAGSIIEYAAASDELILSAGGRITSGTRSVAAGWLRLHGASRQLDARGGVEFSDSDAAGSSAAAAFGSDGSFELTGAPATVSAQTDEGAVSGSADRISRSAGSDSIELAGSARVVRGEEIIAGEQITYDLQTSALDTRAEPGGRVTVIIRQQ